MKVKVVVSASCLFVVKKIADVIIMSQRMAGKYFV